MRAPPVLALLSLGAVVAVQELRPQAAVIDKVTFRYNERRPTIPAESLELMSFGYPRIFSNLLWLRFLQSTPLEKVPKGEISWMYFDLDTITTIDPEFIPAFEHAGIFLSVVTEDKKGAQLLLEKGVRFHPARWRLRAYLAYHYQFELDEPDLAAKQYLAGSALEGAPPLLGLLAARLLARTQPVEASIELLENLKRLAPNEYAKKRFQDRIDQWKRAEGGEAQ